MKSSLICSKIKCIMPSGKREHTRIEIIMAVDNIHVGTDPVRKKAGTYLEKLDLHGLNVEEALAKTNSQIEWLLQKGGEILVINHGKGHHSEHGIGVVRQRVRAVLKEMGPILKQHGYLVVYGESDYPVALEYDGGCTLIVQRGLEHEYVGGRQQVARKQTVFSPEGRELRKQQKKSRRH